MPVYEAHGSLWLHFGHGDIQVILGARDGHPNDVIAFARQTPHEIGAPGEELVGKTTEEADCPVVMTFDRPESIDVVIGHLQRLRDERFPDYSNVIRVGWMGDVNGPGCDPDVAG